MNDVARRQANLPVKPADLQKWVLINKVKLAAQIKAIKNIDQLTDSIAARQAALEDTQDLAEELLYAEARLGKFYSNIESEQGKRTDQLGNLQVTKLQEIEPRKRERQKARDLNQNEAAIAETVAEAREKGEVPVRNQVLRLIQENKPKPDTPPLPKNKFNIIYADPPWKYSDACESGSVQSKGAHKYYPVMSISELCELDVISITTENAALFLWVTSPMLEECFAVIQAWGFKYKASFVWDKIKHNMGHYNSVRHEFLLICTKGSFMPENKKLYDSVQSIERTKHSEKPERFRQIIECLYPSGKKIEFFARSQHKGWEAFGNEL